MKPLDESLKEIQQQLEAERKVSSAFTDISNAILSPILTQNDIYQMVLDKARELTDSEHGFVSSIDPLSGTHVSHTLTKMKVDGCNAPLTEGVLPSGPHKKYENLWGYGLNNRQSFFTNSPSTHPNSRGLPEGHVPMINFLSVPVVFHGLLLGQIALANSTRDYTQRDIVIIEKLAVYYAVVLRNHLWAKALQDANEKLTERYEELARAEQKMRRSAEIQMILREIAESSVLAISMDELYAKVYRLVGRVLPAKLFHINLLDEANGEIVVPFKADHVTFIPERRPVGKGLTEYIMRLGHAEYITPAEMGRLSESGEYTLLQEQNVRELHYLGAPLIDSQRKAFGVISLIQLGEKNAFQADDIEVLSIIAVQVSMAIERKRMEKELQILATIDGLTGIFNRRHFLSLAEKELQRVARYGGACSLMMLDIDHFKMVNDKFGHAIGDAAIQRVAQICADSLRSTDLLGRIGGEEFAMLLPETEIAEAEKVAERLRQRIQDDSFEEERSISCPLRVSIGVSEHKSDKESLATLMNRADEALYLAKQKGRNRVVTA